MHSFAVNTREHRRFTAGFAGSYYLEIETLNFEPLNLEPA
jgi:hypothetical protein